VPELVPIRSGAVNPARYWSDASAVVDTIGSIVEAPSQGRLEGNITAGGEPKIFQVLTGAEALEANLFKNRANLKLLTSKVAMHLLSEQRRSLFSGIDQLLDVAQWEDESSEIDEKAFQSFLRFIIYAQLSRIPNIGVGPDGTVLAGWHGDGKSIHVEFLPADQCTVLIRSHSDRGPERFAWRGHVARLQHVVASNDAIECLRDIQEHNG
jgi:hypothetical protein